MINVDLLQKHRHFFGFVAQQLSYPEVQIDYHPSVIEQLHSKKDQVYHYLEEYLRFLRPHSLEQLQELYVETFDFHQETTLYMSYVKFEDTKERGQMLAKLKILYSMFGLEMSDQEIPDYLPLMCEFLYAAVWQGTVQEENDVSVLISVIEDGTYHLLKGLEKIESPYYSILKALRLVLKSCVRRESLKHEHA